MADLIRHVGKINNTGARVVVVFRKLPDDDSSCLIVETDRLPDSYHQNLMTIVNSADSQQTVDLYNVLARRTFGDGSNVLNTLHSGNFLRKVPTSLVTLYPYPNVALPLTDANVAIDGTTATSTLEEVIEEIPVMLGTPKDQATSKLQVAAGLEQEMEKLREEAYVLCPELRPNKGRPKLSEEEAEAAKNKRNEKRREKYQATKAS